jgi:hypothetical protein
MSFAFDFKNVNRALTVDHFCHLAIRIAMETQRVFRLELAEIQMQAKRLDDLGDSVLRHALGHQDPCKRLVFPEGDGSWGRRGRNGGNRNDFGCNRLGLRFGRRVQKQTDLDEKTGADQ